MGQNDFISFIALAAGLALLGAHLIKTAICIRDTDFLSDIHPLYAHGFYTFLVLPFMFEWFIFDLFWPWREPLASPIAGMLMFIGFSTLAAFLCEWLFKKAQSYENNEENSEVIGICYLVFIGAFIVWRLYEIIIVRGNFWVAIIPIAAVVGVAFGIMQSPSPHQTSSTEPMSQPTPEPDPLPIVEYDEDHPITPDPASVFEKRNRD